MQVLYRAGPLERSIVAADAAGLGAGVVAAGLGAGVVAAGLAGVAAGLGAGVVAAGFGAGVVAAGLAGVAAGLGAGVVAAGLAGVAAGFGAGVVVAGLGAGVGLAVVAAAGLGLVTFAAAGLVAVVSAALAAQSAVIITAAGISISAIFLIIIVPFLEKFSRKFSAQGLNLYYIPKPLLRGKREGYMNDLNEKRVLIIGGAGFLGSNLAIAIQQRFPACRLVVFDSFQTGHFKNLLSYRGELIVGDIRTDRARLEGRAFDCVFHLAGETNEARQLSQVNAFRDTLDLAVQNGADLIYASSSQVYGEDSAAERGSEKPCTAEGFAKLMMDNLALEYLKEESINIAGLRFFEVYGEREAYKGKASSLILQMAFTMLSGARPKLYKWGEQKQDFVYIDDAVNALLGSVSRRGIYDIGTGRAREHNEVFGTLTNALGVSVNVEFIDPPKHLFQGAADTAHARSGLDFQAEYDLEKGIEKYAPSIVEMYEKELR
jgi:ADP-L-glycero-D-manno-heptose 6-epimerase